MDSELRNMVMSFRVTELQTLLAYAGKNKTGRKNELQARALELVRSKPNHVVVKIRELHKSIQMSTMSGIGGTGYNSGGYSSNGVYSNSAYAGSAEKALTRASYSTYGNLKIPGIPAVTLPYCPDVKFIRLPFYDVLSELIKPASLMPHQGSTRAQSSVYEAIHSFCLTPNQAADIASSKEFTNIGEQRIQYAIQVQMRFCLLENSVDQVDLFPPSLAVKVNGKPIQLPNLIPSNRPGVEAKRPSKPLNVTNFVKLSPTCTNTISVTWAPDPTKKGHAMSLFLVRKLSAADLLGRVKAKGIRPPEYTRGMIKEIICKDDGDCQIATTSLKVSIACPLGKSRMSLPCRATTCPHLQCFDANLYLQMNEKKPTWNCPVCDRSLLFENLSIDGYFQEVINKVVEKNIGCNDIEIFPDGAWVTLSQKTDGDSHGPPSRKKAKTESNVKNNKNNETICIDDDMEDDEEATTTSASNKNKQNDEVECIDLLSDSESEEEGEIPAKNKKRANGDESSSSSTEDEGRTTRRRAPIIPQSSSPPIITLDSRSPSPEARPSEPQQRSSSAKSSDSRGSGGGGGGGSYANYSNNPIPVSKNTNMPSLLPMPSGGGAATSSASYSTGNPTWGAYGPTRMNAIPPQPTRGLAQYPQMYTNPYPHAPPAPTRSTLPTYSPYTNMNDLGSLDFSLDSYFPNPFGGNY